MDILQSFPVFLVDDALAVETASGRATRAIIDQLREEGIPVTTASDLTDAEQIIASTAALSALLIDWDTPHRSFDAGDGRIPTEPPTMRIRKLIEGLRSARPELPIFVLADRTAVDALPPALLELVDAYIWKLEDTPAFVVAHVQTARRAYLDGLLPPFFDALTKFTEAARYSWHTPGHSGGTAFLRSPVGTAFHRFFGENTLRSDLSVSVGELGSLMEHTGPIGLAEQNAARVFGADRTLFVTNGTSTANKIVFHSCVRRGDVVLVDRNCHKSVMHAIVMTGAIPVYMRPTRNPIGIIGPIPASEMSTSHVAQLLADHPLVPPGVTKARLAVVTNSTYDGLCYDAAHVLELLGDVAERVLFDEAWFAYAHFHPMYAGRHAMGIEHRPGQPSTFATQSTHKLLTAFSQASMVHLTEGEPSINQAALDEAFMMHTSTSPQYGIIASLDVATQTMDGPQGTRLIDETIDAALDFRRELAAVQAGAGADAWSFGVWQPPGAELGAPDRQRDPSRWALQAGDGWHGYGEAADGHTMLDPLKVTVLTPGIAPDGALAPAGVPAALVSRFLDERGIVVEKTGAYSFLVLFSLGITRSKAGTLVAELLEFRRLHREGAPLAHAMPRLIEEHGDRYGHLTIVELADQLHAALVETDLTALSNEMYGDVPQTVSTPAAAYEQLVGGGTELVELEHLAGRVSTAMVVPYPPGIPVIMPGERFGSSGSALIRYLKASESLAQRFPGFETEIHGIHTDERGAYAVPCVALRVEVPGAEAPGADEHEHEGGVPKAIVGTESYW